MVCNGGYASGPRPVGVGHAHHCGYACSGRFCTTRYEYQHIHTAHADEHTVLYANENAHVYRYRLPCVPHPNRDRHTTMRGKLAKRKQP